MVRDGAGSPPDHCCVLRWLPVEADQREAVSPGRPGHVAHVSAPPRILIVDDTPENVLLLSNVLEAQGYEVVTASSGAAALELIAAGRHDLVLLDVVMPQ